MSVVDLRALWEANEYPAEVDGEPLRLVPERASESLDRALARRGLASAAYVTATDPYPHRLSPVENARRNEALRAQLAGRYEVLDAPGGFPPGAPDPKGEREPSFLVLGLDEAEAWAICARHGQAGFVLHLRGEPTRVVMLGEPSP